jgi:large subunit ribosomal protein L15
MPLNLHSLKPNKDAKKKRKRVGRGDGSNKGTYSGRGLKGQRARSGGKSGLKLRGLRDVLFSLPKLGGFKSNRPDPKVVNVEDLNEVFSDGETVDPTSLVDAGLIDEVGDGGVKVLGEGDIEIGVTLQGCDTSKSAKAKIEDAGGEVV